MRAFTCLPLSAGIHSMTESGMIWQQMMLAIHWSLPQSVLSCRIQSGKNKPDVMNCLMFKILSSVIRHSIVISLTLSFFFAILRTAFKTPTTQDSGTEQGHLKNLFAKIKSIPLSPNSILLAFIAISPSLAPKPLFQKILSFELFLSIFFMKPGLFPQIQAGSHTSTLSQKGFSLLLHKSH